MPDAILPCTQEDSRFICERLIAYNLQHIPQTQPARFTSIARKILDENGEIIAGCIAEIYYWDIMELCVLWVDANHRKQGLGSRLLREAEAAAAGRGCSLIYLDTFDFQAKDFYLRHGYEVFGVLEDCPEGHCRYYLKKKLKA